MVLNWMADKHDMCYEYDWIALGNILLRNFLIIYVLCDKSVIIIIIIIILMVTSK